VRDYDLTHVAPVLTTTVGGQQRTLIALTGNDGLLRVLDRDTHNVHYSTPFTTRENAKARGWLTAFDAATGATRWRYQSSKPMIGGIAVSGGDVGLRVREHRQLPRARRRQGPLQS
jgi:hypothetical protein